MPIIFGGKKTARLGAIKAQLSFSESKCQLLNSWNTISFPRIFCHLSFQQYRIRTDQIMLAHTNIPFEGHSEI